MFQKPQNLASLFLLPAIFAFSNLKAASLSDTSVKKNTALVSHNSYNFSDNAQLYKDAITAFQHDSLDNGVHLLAAIFKRLDAETKITRALNYRGLELVDFVKETDNGAVDLADKRLIELFIEAACLHKDANFIKDLENQLKNLPETPFNERLKLYFLTYKNDKQLGKEGDKVLRDNPNVLSLNTFKAESLFDEDKNQESNVYCNKLIALWPMYAHAYELRGNNYRSLDSSEKAVSDFDEAIKLFPENKLFYYDRACALMDNDKYHEAIADLQKMHLFNPDYLWTSYNLAKCYNETKMPDSALYFINMHIKEYPADDDGYDLKGTVYYGRNDYPSAVEYYNEAVKLSPAKEEFYEDRGDAYFYSDKYTEALADFLKAVKLDKDRAYAQDRVGDCYYQLKQYQKAISFHEQAIKVKPSYKYAYVGISECKIELGDYAGAIANCKKALEIDSTYDTANGDLGWDYYCAGDDDACIKWSYKAINYDEQATYAMFNIALATLHKGDSEKAKALYVQFINKCKEKGYTINDGAVDDLKNLIKRNIAVDDCKFIIVQLFGKEL